MLTNQEIKDRLLRYQKILEPFIVKEVHLSISDKDTAVEFTTTLLEVNRARLSDMTNKPDKRTGYDKEGKQKQYTPPCLVLKCSDGMLYFVIEDLTIQQGLQGVTLYTYNTVCKIKEV